MTVLSGCQLGDDWQLRYRANRPYSCEELVHVEKGLKDEQVDATGLECPGLVGECRGGFLYACFAPRFDAHTEWADRPGNPRPISRHALRETRALLVDEHQLVRKTEVAQLETIGAEGVRLDDICARRQVLTMDVGHQIRLRQIQLVEAAVQEDPFAIEHCPHGAIADEHALIESLEEALHEERALDPPGTREHGTSEQLRLGRRRAPGDPLCP